MRSKLNIDSISKIINVLFILILIFTAVLAYNKKSAIVGLSALSPITKVDTDKKVIAIACNVYEGKEEIEKILDIAEKKKVKISFFIGGIWAKRNPEIIKVMYEKGHDIQNHGYLHKRHSTLNKEDNLKEIKKTEDLLYDLLNIKTTLFEPPYGDYDENTLAIANSLGYKVVTWSIDTIDWRSDATKDIILNRIKKKLHAGGIILTHPMKVTSSSIEDIIDYLHNEGYEIKTVKELLDMR